MNLFRRNFFALLAVAVGLHAQPSAPRQIPASESPALNVIALWGSAAPDALGERPEDQPTLTVFAPSRFIPNSRTAVIIAPGGAYQMLAGNHEGRQVADWFAAHGVAAFVLTYRLVSAGYHHPVQLRDAQRAVRLVRARAAEFGVDPARIGMVGFSAGGHLATMVATQGDDGDTSAADPIDRVGSRIAFMVLGYPGVLRPGNLATQLLGENPDPKTAGQVNTETHITAQTPPTFIFHTSDDALVSAPRVVDFYKALQAARVPVELHVFEHGIHGVGLGQTDPALRLWPTLLENWLDRRGLLRPPNTAP